MLLSKCAVCDRKKLDGFSSNTGLKTPVTKIPLLGGILF